MFRRLDQREQKFYNQVAEMIKRINSRLSTFKTEIYKTRTPERFHAILHKVLVNYDTLTKINRTTEYMKNVPLGCVIIYELLTGKLKNDGYSKKFKRALGEEKLILPEESIFVRLNNQVDLKEIEEAFEFESTPITGVYKLLSVKNASTSVKKHIAVNFASKLKIQSFESCMPVWFLKPKENSILIDATAAPGNKTTQASDMMKNTGKIHAFEKDSNRFQNLLKNVEEQGCTNIVGENKDFLTVDPKSIAADYIIVDPSCSGSGIHFNYKKEAKRIEKLSNFQAMIINHALKFNAKKVVYSVCSTHVEEAENVVKEALEKNPAYELEAISMEDKPHGKPDFDFAEKVVRSEKEIGKSYGFFVCLFKRKEQ